MDSYEAFLRDFKIDKKAFLEWGISSTIFPPVSNVEKEWILLKKRILNNEKVCIRGYGRDSHGTQLYQKLYQELFRNFHVEKDADNNREPHKRIQALTGYKRNVDLFNYQVSHIWGRTKNIFLFEAPWNLCYTPKIMDPFTGHETKGDWPVEYQKLFFSKARELYQPFIDEYNELLFIYHVDEKVEDYVWKLKGTISEREWLQFSKDVKKELSPIV